LARRLQSLSLLAAAVRLPVPLSLPPSLLPCARHCATCSARHCFAALQSPSRPVPAGRPVPAWSPMPTAGRDPRQAPLAAAALPISSKARPWHLRRRWPGARPLASASALRIGRPPGTPLIRLLVRACVPIMESRRIDAVRLPECTVCRAVPASSSVRPPQWRRCCPNRTSPSQVDREVSSRHTGTVTRPG